MKSKWAAKTLAENWEMETYTTSGRYWRFRCPVPGHGGGKPFSQRSTDSMVVWDIQPGEVGIRAFSYDCSLVEILGALERCSEWTAAYRKDPKGALYQRFPECRHCRERYEMGDLEVDHRIPKAQGGKDHPRNMTLLCKDCHKEKTRQDNRKTDAMRKAGQRVGNARH